MRWYNGNVYHFKSALPHLVTLDAGEYDLVVSYIHDIRIAGSPGATGVPTNRWSLTVEEVSARVEATFTRAAPSVVGGVIMGTVVGLEVKNTLPVEIWVTSIDSTSDAVRFTTLSRLLMDLADLSITPDSCTSLSAPIPPRRGRTRSKVARHSCGGAPRPEHDPFYHGSTPVLVTVDCIRSVPGDV